MLGTNKSNSARQIVSAMRRDTKPIAVKCKGAKIVEYKGYTIKVWPPLVPGGAKRCSIGKNDVGLAFRHSLEEAKEYVDHETAKTTAKVRCRIHRSSTPRKRNAKPKMEDCPRCKATGLYFDRICVLCKGTGEREKI